MDWPALAAAIGGPTVGAVAILSGRRDARDARTQTLKLAEREHEHERDLRRADRIYEDRRDAYLAILRLAYHVLETLERYIEFVEKDGDTEVETLAGDYEAWLAAQARIGLFATSRIADKVSAYEDVRASLIGLTADLELETEEGRFAAIERLQDKQSELRRAVVDLRDALHQEIANA